MALISFKYRLIFVKTAKTAGTSIETDLSQRLEDAAIVTPILPPEPGHVARNYQSDTGEALYFNHMPATLIRDRLGADLFNSMTRICVDREPVERCISHFHMLRNSTLHNPGGAYQHSWADYVAEGDFPTDMERYCDMRDGNPVSLMTHILRYDRLDSELPALLDSLGIPDFRLTARAKSDYSKNRLISVSDVTPDQRATIYDAFAPSLRVSGIDWSA